MICIEEDPKGGELRNRINDCSATCQALAVRIPTQKRNIEMSKLGIGMIRKCWSKIAHCRIPIFEGFSQLKHVNFFTDILENVKRSSDSSSSFLVTQSHERILGEGTYFT